MNSATGTVVKRNMSLYPTVPIGSQAVKSFPPATVTIRSPPTPPRYLSKREDGGSAFPQKGGQLATRLQGYTCQKTVLFII